MQASKRDRAEPTKNVPSGVAKLFGPKCGLSLGPACALLDRAAWGCPPSLGRVTDTREKESPLIILRPEIRGRIGCPGSRGMEHLVVVKALICAEPESLCSGVHVTCGPISPHALSVLWFVRLACFIIYRVD
ncbi:hypothetical protein CRG98_018776 [Punica granatum]|uniref:Uncharacterized protein n=1 Tax=Punica granatum TaxID=22663 RepID=A0A2I0JX27_PUNGR|nr:hypothetical protein CRG98_018776 [Punica granatum]